MSTLTKSVRTYRKIRKSILHSREIAWGNLRDETEAFEGGQGHWALYNSPIGCFNEYFRKVISERSMDSFLRCHYRGRSGLIGLEIGGPGSKLFSEIRKLLPGTFQHTAGVALFDARSRHYRRLDAANSHDFIAADAFSGGAYKSSAGVVCGFNDVHRWISRHGKADLVIERMAGPLGPFARNKNAIDFFGRNLFRWYRVLNVFGTMLIQLPEGSAQIQRELKRLPSEMFDIHRSKGRHIALTRLPGSPDRLEELLEFRPM